MRSRPGFALVALLAVGVGLSACSGGEGKGPVRIGLRTLCHGSFGPAYEANIGAVELPLIERGARLAGTQPSDGLVDAEVAGRKVDLVIGCGAEGGDAYASPLELLEVRRLVEREHADVIVGIGGPMSIAVRNYAKKHPGVAFVSGYEMLQSTTLREPAANVFSLIPDYTMESAGLGAYAYNSLGWRKAITIDDDEHLGWASTAGFVAAFCSLGGEVVERVWIPSSGPSARRGADPDAVVKQIPPEEIDGAYWGAGDPDLLAELGRRLPLLRGDLGGKIVGHWHSLSFVPELFQAFGERLDGVAHEPGALNPGNRAFAAYAQDYTKTFPGQSELFGLFGGQHYYTSMEAVLRAVERVDGDITGGRLLAALAKTDMNAPQGHLRLDERRQAIAPAYVVENRWDKKTKSLVGERTLTYADVDQTFGGYFTPDSPPPSRTSPSCKKLKSPPAWARR